MNPVLCHSNYPFVSRNIRILSDPPGTDDYVENEASFPYRSLLMRIYWNTYQL